MNSSFLSIFVSLYMSTAFQAGPMPEPCNSLQAYGCAVAPNLVWIDPANTRLSTALRNHVIYHEVGHVFDFKYMGPASRVAFGAILGDDREWQEGKNPLIEKFGEAVALCMDGRFDALVGIPYDYKPTRSQYRRACRLIETVYKDSQPVL